MHMIAFHWLVARAIPRVGNPVNPAQTWYCSNGPMMVIFKKTKRTSETDAYNIYRIYKQLRKIEYTVLTQYITTKLRNFVINNA